MVFCDELCLQTSRIQELYIIYIIEGTDLKSEILKVSVGWTHATIVFVLFYVHLPVKEWTTVHLDNIVRIKKGREYCVSR